MEASAHSRFTVSSPSNLTASAYEYQSIQACSKGHKSDVWDYFKQVKSPSSGKRETKCLLCGRIFSERSGFCMLPLHEQIKHNVLVEIRQTKFLNMET